MEKIAYKDLKLGDVVRLNGIAAWDTAIVKQIKDGEVHLFRPYGTTAGFEYTGGVICYTGIEEFSLPASEHTVTLVQRGSVS